jgi:hypothetical protein
MVVSGSSILILVLACAGIAMVAGLAAVIVVLVLKERQS